MIHERDWGEYGMTPRAEHSTRFPHTYRLKEAAPLHARLDGGESLADSVAMRVNDHRQELKDKWSGKRTITVSHGETISVVRYVYESMLPEDFDAMEKDKTQRIGNCAILWYTRENPFDRNDVRPYLGWRRMIQPDDPKKSPFGGEWCELPDRRHMSGIELLNSAENFPRLTSQQNQAA
jgi:broad specificity phosphatase PhoE